MYNLPVATPLFPVDAFLRDVAARTEGWLEALLDARAPQGPAELWEAIRSAVLGGGKRLREILAARKIAPA